MLMKKTKQRITAMLLSVIMLLGMMPVAAAAETGSLPIGEGGEITAFEALGSDIAVRSVPLGTSKMDLKLPDTLAVTIQLAASEDESALDSGDAGGEPVASPSDAEKSGGGTEELTVPLPVTWASSPEYDGEAAGTYLFTPELPEGLILISGVNAPTITVTVSAPETTDTVDATAITGSVTDFDALSDELRWQNTTAPEFPETVGGTVEGEAAEIPVTWEADHDYDAEAPGRGLYVFTAVLGEGYALADGVELPRITVFIPVSAGRMAARMAGGGVSDSPLEITTAAQLAEIATLVNARENGLELFLFNDAGEKVSLALQNDIDLSAYANGEGWVPIGNKNNPFKGSFDGRGHKISKLTINRSGMEQQGLFGHISAGSAVKNLGVENVAISAKNYVGGVAGEVRGGTVQNCYTTGSVGGNIYVGGVLGVVFENSTVQNCYSTSIVDGTLNSFSFMIGGLVGGIYDSTVINCFVTGSVIGNSSSSSTYTGGLTGYLVGESTMQNCAALNPSVSGRSIVARVAGGWPSDSPVLSGNLAFSGMTVTKHGVMITPPAEGADQMDGETKTAANIKAAGFFEALFGNDTAWTYATGKLPGFGAAIDMPEYLVDGSDPNFRGAGTSTNPYQITTPAELAKLAELVNAAGTNAAYGGPGVCYQLINDLDLSAYASADGGKGWTPIGTNANRFKGSFDGGAHQITGLYINRRSANTQGLFGWLGSGGRIENLGVVNVNITGNTGIGGVTGAISGGTVQNCYSTGSVSGTNNIGGVTGVVSGGTVQNCYSTGSVTGTSDSVGGVAGLVSGGTVQNCYSTNSVSGYGEIGGVAGRVITGSTLRNCYSAGSVTGVLVVGGVAGYVTTASRVESCAALNSSVSGTSDVGRVAGSVDSGTLSGNIAFGGMTVTQDGSAKLIIDNADGLDGLSVTAAAISADGTLGGLFTTANSWTTENGRLPGFGAAMEMPPHLLLSGASPFPGSGESEGDPYRISTPAQLAKLAVLVNAGNDFDEKHFKLQNDLDFSVYGAGYDGGQGWTPIGTDTAQFKGSFDGGSNQIAGLYINRTDAYQGLFGYVGSGGTVKNLGLTGASVTGVWEVGGVAGHVDYGTVENCSVTGNVGDANSAGDIGGVVGYIYNGTVENCHATGSVSGVSNIGGVVGRVNESTVKNCYSAGSVSGNNDVGGAAVGGVAGFVDNGTVESCYSTSSVTGADSQVGGVAGYIRGMMQNCYSTGSVSGNNNVGGVAGYIRGMMQNCYSTGSVSGNNNVGGVAGYVGEGSLQSCYATGSVSGKDSVGGVAGIALHCAVKNCAALNPSVNGVSNVGRVAGVAGYIYSSTLSRNYAFSRMHGIWANKGPGAKDGADVTSPALFGSGFWTDGVNWDSDAYVWNDPAIWTVDDGKLPILTGLSGQNGDGGLYLTVRDIQYAAATPGSLTYNGSEQVPSLTVTFDDQTLTENTDYTVAVVSAGTSAGTNAGTLTLTGIGNFSGAKTVSYTIDPKPVTITPDSGQSKVYGAADPALTYANSEGLGTDVFTGVLSYASGENAGNHPFTLGTLSVGGNYALSLAPGVDFTIEQREITLTADDKTVVKGSGLPALTYTVSNLAPGESSTDALSAESVLACPTFNGNRPGSYSIILTGGTATGNYIIASRIDGTLTVSNPTPSGGYTPPVVATPFERKPDQPVTVAAPITATAGTNGTASVAVSDKTITDAITKAQADAKAQGKTANGIAVELNITMPQGASSLDLTLSQNALQSLVNAGVTSLTINSGIVSLGLDLEALKEIQRQSTGDVTITIKPMTNLSAAAKKLIGKRPVYDVTVSYIKAGKLHPITSLGKGGATLSLPYSPGRNEAVGWLFGVYVDNKGNASRIPGSAYDANSGSLILNTNHFSVYGVGYTAPTEQYTDIASHWAKESIDYVVGRGLFSGTTEKTFSPNMAMDRGMLVTVLGRLADVDVKAYTTNSFTDVKADRAFRPYIEWAYKKGIVQGIGNQQFAPDRAITREEIAIIFANYTKATGYKLPVTREANAYADASSIGSGYKTAVTAIQQAGIMMGGTGNKFNPKASATRAEVSSMLHRYIKLTIDPATAQGWAKNDAGQYLYYKDGKALIGTQTIDGVKYFFETNGTLKTGWVKDGDNWRYYSGNKALTGWWDIGSDSAKKTYYFDTNGSMTAERWLQMDGKWYYFNKDGSLAKSIIIDGYEIDENGVRKSK